MYPTESPFAARRCCLRLLLLAVAAGCTQYPGGPPAPPAAPAAEQPAPTVTTVKPERRTVRRTVGQPGSIQAFEQTPVVAKVPGYVAKWNVDIGAHVRKGDVLAELWVPELVAELKQKDEQVRQAEKALAMARASQAEKEAAKDKAEADVGAAGADRQRVAALAGYARLTAPYDGVVTQRNINTGQFVQPATSARGDVLFLVERTDPVRIFVAVPEADAAWVGDGAPARVRVQALLGQEFGGQVTRTSWSLNSTTRTLRAEIDLPNPDGRLRPGMYAYATVTGEHRGVLTVPAAAVVTQGDVNTGYQTFCYLVAYGKVRRTPLEAGARNDQLVEVVKKRTKPARQGAEPRWEPFTGEEEVVKGDLSGLKDGQAVEVRAGK
jgi:RND family efflux transporter MFP subunit